MSNPQIIISPRRTVVLQVSKQGPAGLGSQGVQSFTGQTIIAINHNRGYRPIVALTNTDGNEIDGAVEHLSLNSFTVTFNLPQSGQVAYF